jgi:regulator of nonsense transcripts 1
MSQDNIIPTTTLTTPSGTEHSNKYRKTSTGRLADKPNENDQQREPGKRKYAHLLPPSRKKSAAIQQTGSSVLPVVRAPPEISSSQGRGRKIQTRAPDPRAVPNILDSNVVSGRKVYHDLYSKLLSFEIQEEMKEVDDRLLNWTKAKLIRDGCTLLDLKGAGSGFINNELTLTFEHKSGGLLPSNKFVPGDIVVITEANTSCTVRLEGLVSSVGKTTINISCRNLPDNFGEKIWRIDRGANQNAFTRMSDALKIFSSNRAETDDYLKEWARNTKIPACYLPPSGKQSPFKSIIIDNIKEAEKQASEPSILSPLHNPDKIKAIMEDWPLNGSQYQTIVDVLGRRLSLIQGPPGTGKTHTAIHLLLLLVKLYADENIPILATAYTNVATDNLLQGLRSHGVEALRLGRPVKVRDELRDCTLQSHLERHPQRPMLDQLREELSKLKGDAYHDKLREIKLLETTMTTEIVAKARVICTTCIGAGDPILTDQYFPLVVIDESTQAIEPAILVPMTKGAQQVIFLGDHYQLPPTVKSPKAELLKDSLFHRLVKEGNLKPFVLNSQYRMHPLISEFPSSHFYHGQIKDAISAKIRPLPKGFPWKDNKPLVLLHTDGKEVSTETGSRSNPVEASIVVDIIRQFLADQDLTKSDIGIVTPYAGQVNHLTLLLNKDPLLSVATDRDVMDEGEDARTQLTGGLNVASVDGFQGREKEVIIFSSVRSNTTGTVGFLADWRRLNVAITRARRGLIVVGNINTLCNDPHWHAWLTWMGAQRLILDYNDWKAGKITELPVPDLRTPESEGSPNKVKTNARTPSPKKQQSVELTLPVAQYVPPVTKNSPITTVPEVKVEKNMVDFVPQIDNGVLAPVVPQSNDSSLPNDNNDFDGMDLELDLNTLMENTNGI